MATITVTEVPEVEVTNKATSEEKESTEDISKFAKLRRRITKGSADGTNRPSDSKWRQQQIPACRPVFSAKHVCVAFSVIGLVFIGLGILFTVTLARLNEVSHDYTQCEPFNSTVISDSFKTCAEYVICKRDCTRSLNSVCTDFLNKTEINSSSSCQDILPNCQCRVNITSTLGLRPAVHVYYAINNYYQNHRRYLNSLDLQQLHGDYLKSPSDECRPIIRENGTDLPILPCGLIANSWFNDTIDRIEDTNTTTTYNINSTNIAWETDRNYRFNPSATLPNASEIAKPPNWPTGISDVPNGLSNEALIVWFRVSAFPWFRKLYGRIHSEMPASTYAVTISYSYPVTDFNGAKSVILAEVSWLGGRNLFLGAAYIVVGAFLIVAGIALLIVHLTCSKWKESDKNFLQRSY